METRYFMLLMLAPFALSATDSRPEQPDYVPVCNSPQALTGPQPGGPFNGSVTAATAVWNGTDYAVLSVNSGFSTLNFQRYYADGSKVSSAVNVTGATTVDQSVSPAMAWNGFEYGVAWTTSGAPARIYFALLDRSGAVLSGPTLVNASATPTSEPALATNGSAFFIAYTFRLSGSDYDIYASNITSAGAVSAPFIISNPGAFQQQPTVAWDAQASGYTVAWSDNAGTTGSVYIIRGAFTQGSPPATILDATVANGSNASHPRLVSQGGGFGLTWINNGVNFMRVQYTGAPASSPIAVYVGGSADSASLAFTGAEFWVVWSDARTGSYEAYLQRVTSSGALTGGNSAVSSSSGASGPCFAAGPRGLLLVQREGFSQAIRSIGCTFESSPPSCAGNYLAYNITGTAASISWSPSFDNETDLAYYQVYRNNTPLAKTTDTFYNDTGLSTSVTYNYFVQPVNAAQMQNGNCTASIYIKTNSSLTLTLNKSNPNAVLNWTDAGFNNYNVFRGNDPRVMQQIGNTPALTTQDTNALNDTLNYFYTVDDPGQ